MRSAVVFLIVSVVAFPLVRAQAPSVSDTTPLAFEVASIKPVLPPVPAHTVSLIVTPGRLTINAATLRQVIGLAYGVQRVRVVGGPAWIDLDQHNFAAVQKADASRDEIRAMLQRLIAQRFGVVLHHETREITVYRLTRDAGGSKIQQAKAGDNTNVAVEQGQITYSNQSMVILVNTLANLLEAPVLDETGLQGTYNFAVSMTDNGVPLSIFTVVREQLGLRLEPSKGPVDVLVIDHVERPTEN